MISFVDESNVHEQMLFRFYKDPQLLTGRKGSEWYHVHKYWRRTPRVICNSTLKARPVALLVDSAI